MPSGVHAHSSATAPMAASAPLPVTPLSGERRAAFEGNVDELRRLLPRLTFRQKLQLDGQGNTVGRLVVG